MEKKLRLKGFTVLFFCHGIGMKIEIQDNNNIMVEYE